MKRKRVIEMFQLLIVEDEKIEREYLKSIIEEANVPISNIFTASNGEEAIYVCKENDCDIIFLDIEMPLKNGLDALKEIRKIERKKSICFVLSSYSTFQYAQQAIQLHVEDFILKPSSKNNIIEHVMKACNELLVRKNSDLQMNALVNKINTIFPILEKQLAMSILLGKSDIEIQKQFKLQNLFMKSGICFLFDIHTEVTIILNIKNNLEDQGYSCLCVDFEPYQVMFIIASFVLNQEDIERLKEKIDRFTKNYSYGSIATNNQLLLESYKNADEMMKRNCTKEKSSGSCQESVILLFELYEHNNEDELKNEIQKNIRCIIQKENYKKGSGKEYLVRVIEAIKEELKKRYPNYKFREDEFLMTKITEMDLNYQFNNLFYDITTKKMQGLDHITKETIKYVKHNYMKQISLQDVADQLQITPSYISRILNKQLKKSFTDIINEYRVQAAKQLIKNGVVLKEVAHQTGFRSQSYFTQIFKKATGISPRDYQNLF